MEFTEVRYVVSDLMGVPQVLTVDSSGRSSYRSHANSEFLDHPEIGLYETTLDSSRVTEIGRTLSKWPLGDLPDHEATMPEGEPWRLLRVTSQQGVVIKQIGPVGAVDPRLQELLDFFDAVVFEVMKSPRRVLTVSISNPMTGPGDTISVELQLSNESKEPVYLRRPADLVNQTNGWLRMEVWPVVSDPKTTWAGPMAYVDVEQVEGKPEENERTNYCTIAPWTNRTFVLRGRLSNQHGAHGVRVSYCNLSEQIDGKSLIVGHVYTKPLEFKIQ